MVPRRESLPRFLILFAPSAVSAICSGSTIGVGNLQKLANGTNRWSFFDNNCNTASFVDLTTNPCTSFFSCSAAPITFTGYTNQTDQSRYTCKPDGTAESCANNVAVSVCCVQGSVSISPTTSTTFTSAPASSSTSPSSSSTSSLGTSSSLSSSSLPSTTLISTNSQISSSPNSTSTSTSSSSQIPAGTTSFQITSDPFPSSIVLASTTSSSLSNAGVSLLYTGSVSGAAAIGAAVIGAIYGSLAV